MAPIIETTHTIVVTVRGYDGVDYDMVCSDPEKCQAVYKDGRWETETDCRCEDTECLCREGDHGDCSEFDGWITEIGPTCRAVPVDGCGLVEWLNAVGEELLGEWEGVTVEVPIQPDWSSFDGPIFEQK